MQPDQPANRRSAPEIKAGQTIIFLGDHTSPDEQGYVRVIGDVLARFHPRLQLNLISAGSQTQTGAALQSRNLIDLLLSSRPDWLVLGIGLADALREPGLAQAQREYLAAREAAGVADETFGPEYRVDPERLGPADDVGRMPAIAPRRLETFLDSTGGAVTELQAAGIGVIVLTTVLLGDDVRSPLNRVLKSYSKALRQLASEKQIALVDVERAFNDLFLRAGQYKQRVALASVSGELTPQGQALMARTFLNEVGLLPYPGFRPPRT